MGINDLAIIYQSKMYKIRGKIDILNSVGIKGQRYLKELEEIEKYTNDQIEDNSINIETIYSEATTKLEEIERELEKYNNYIAGYHYCEYLESKIREDKVSEEEIKEYANKIRRFIDLINNEKTSDYSEEKEIVEKVYYVAYQVMKLEFITLGESEIFSVAKRNPAIESIINKEIASDINKLKDDNKITPLMKQLISKIQSSGINYSYLDKLLITSIALEEDDSIICKVRNNLDELLAKIKNNTSKMESTVEMIKKAEAIITYYDKQINKNNRHNTKEILKRTVAGIVAGALLYGSYTIGRLSSKVYEYKTKKETYSSLNGYSSKEYYLMISPEYSKNVKLNVYEPYEEYKTRYSDYRRKYTSYDISNIADDCNTLEDFLKLDLEQAYSKKTDYEFRNAINMSEEDFYDELIYEVVKIIQNPDDVNIENNYLTWGFISFLILILSGTAYVSAIKLFYSIGGFKEIIKNSDEKIKLRENLISLKTKLEAYRRLADNNKELKDEFTKIFNNFKEFINFNDTTKSKEDDAIMVDDPQIELDKRTKKLLRFRVKE